MAPDGFPAFEGQTTLWAWSPDGLTPVARLHYAVSDAIGTPQELLGGDGSLAWAARHHLWGAANDQQAVETDCPLRFPGQIADGETGLYYNRFRYYDPQTTQYLTPDPIGLNGGLRSWGYVENPATWIDPLGLAGCPPKIEAGKQGKHIRGHNNFIEGRSEITHPDPQKLVDDFAGKGVPVNKIPVGQPGYRERFNSGNIIGRYYNQTADLYEETTNGIIHYSKKGVHIVPSEPLR